ncbi:MAG: type II toxin-antitoxin system RelE/ParE family toxin [Pirellulaceae bacterium]
MSGEPFIKPQVYLDLDELAAWIQRDSPQAALRFLNEAETTFQSLADMPGSGSLYAVRNLRLAGLRCSTVRGFPNHLIFYLPIRNGIDVVRVLHGARDLPRI